MQRSVSAAGSLNKSPVTPSSGIEASASFQSHFSNSNLAHRFRTLPGLFADLEKQAFHDDEDAEDGSSPAPTPPSLAQRSKIHDLKSRFKCSLLVYACFSVLFLPVSVLQTFGYLSCGLFCAIRQPSAELEVPYLLDFTDNPRFLSKVTSLGSNPSIIHPFALHGVSQLDGITACLWSRSDQLESVLSWGKRWPGPISLVLTTTTSPQSAQHRHLLERVSHVYTHASPNSSLSLHLLHVKPSAQENPNAYINLARLFSETNQVVLFPRRLLNLDPQSAHSLFQKHLHSNHSSKPAVLTASGRSSFPFSAFSPVLLHRDDHIWCDERFALTSSGAFDWQECLWQFWIAKYGSIRALTVSQNSWPVDSPISESPVRTTIRNYLHTKFREEICLLATRQINVFVTGEGREAHPKHIKQGKWLTKACRQWKFNGA